MQENIFCEQVEYGGEDYRATVELRNAVLRVPLGIKFDPKELTTEGDSFHLACWAGEQLVACCVAKPVDDKLIRLRQMAVAPQCQRQGFGRRLIEFTEDFLRHKGYREIELHARKTAIGFYETLGYATEGEEFIEVGVPHKQMRKKL